jgi:O-antigen/teichoic acid export membrane protein
LKKIVEHIKQLSIYDTLRHGSAYMLSFVFIQVVMVLTIPLFTKLLTPSDFGIYEVYNNTVRFLAVIISLNLYAGFYRYYFEENMDKRNLMQFLLRLSFIVFLSGVFLLILCKDLLLRLTNLPADLFIWIVVGIFTTIVINFFSTYNNAQQFSKRLGLWQLVIQIARVAAAFLFIHFISKNYLGRVAGENAATLVLALIIIAVYFRKYLAGGGHLPGKMEIVRYSAGFIPIGLSSYIVSYIDLVLINNLQGSTASGVYSYAYKFAIIYSGFSQAFVTANRPNLFNLLKENKEEEVISQMRSMFKLITVFACSFIFFAADAGRILSLNEEFDVALHLLPVLILAYVFSDIAEIYNFYLYYAKKVKLFYVSFVSTAIVNFLLNLWLIPRYGYEIAAYTTLFSFMVLFLATYWVCKFFTDLAVTRWTVFIWNLLIIFLAMTVSYSLSYSGLNVWWVIAIKLSLFLIIVVYMFQDKLKKILVFIKH